ncbi:hypothetical protein HDU88_002344 [Geranomyces variabilis]|nr:hypothetical protein HDU88_002344 [Geranomyces variabilis]
MLFSQGTTIGIQHLGVRAEIIAFIRPHDKGDVGCSSSEVPAQEFGEEGTVTVGNEEEICGGMNSVPDKKRRISTRIGSIVKSVDNKRSSGSGVKLGSVGEGAAAIALLITIKATSF